jgi:hypothetical protein
MGGYLVLALLYLMRFWAVILNSEYLLLGLAVFFLGISAVGDVLPIPVLGSYVVEDSAKFVGIVSWLAYFSRVSALALEREGPAASLPR